jgi:hypothetical protein
MAAAVDQSPGGSVNLDGQMFSPGIWWSGSRVKRLVWETHALQMNS